MPHLSAQMTEMVAGASALGAVEDKSQAGDEPMAEE